MTCCTEYMRPPVCHTQNISVERTIGERDWGCIDRATYKLPSLLRYLICIGDRFHKRFVHNSRFRYPNRTQEVNPISEHSLLERAPFIGAQNTGLKAEGQTSSQERNPFYHGCFRGDGAFAT